MAIDMSEIVGRDNMLPEAKELVLQILRAIPAAAHELKHGYLSWARQAGHQPTAQELAAVAGIRKKRRPR